MPPEKALVVLQQEVKDFGQGLDEKKFLIAANKIDIDADRQSLDRFLQEAGPELAARVFPISAAAHQGLDGLVAALYKILHEKNEEDF
jgi:GTPase involved in cell partitioning and DNA repair